MVNPLLLVWARRTAGLTIGGFRVEVHELRRERPRRHLVRGPFPYTELEGALTMQLNVAESLRARVGLSGERR